ncbi:MAG: hypothetical protein P5702_21725 [Limnospira sp. PMC 1291.21]|uniref:Uncharacterized protein n=1 Tax=Limnospira fusiformis PMC 851.14 TaxID=2219512 RepID=A0ABU9ELL8_LIMFS|nr:MULTISPECIES: hypothetical protein [Limnospira]MDT9180291.1 hypothetical protein [Limnospira sp. PMC 1238.20]MDT9190471.1 hypothetical protein [Limnospira sp. PMC 894.15]MDT9195555.1 hypothetical protein [Limnospira sp. PMC 1245.20]MDT9205840.1 hypothetical protein [Limnospira sp. PMC 1243.20]MDT9210954.1 hypothetical protein [Limnospira sp. PMC 1252.20]
MAVRLIIYSTLVQKAIAPESHKILKPKPKLRYDGKTVQIA